MDIEFEKSLVVRAKTEVSAFVELYEAYYARIFGYALRRTANVQQAQDVTSEVFFKALKHLNNFQWRGISFSSWLFRIASNEIVESFRRNSHYHRSVTLDSCTEVEASKLAIINDEVTNLDDKLVLRDGLFKLPKKYQEVISLKYFEDKELKEIAEILGKPENTVKSLLYRGLDHLKKIIEQ